MAIRLFLAVSACFVILVASFSPLYPKTTTTTAIERRRLVAPLRQEDDGSRNEGGPNADAKEDSEDREQRDTQEMLNRLMHPDDHVEVDFGDPLRAASGVRPSLHPIAINVIAEALKNGAARSKRLPLDKAMYASELASEAIFKRQVTSEADGMKLNEEEGQAVAGRIVGVVVRLEELEGALVERVSDVGWVAKYGEWNSFGVLPEECGDGGDREKAAVDEAVANDPLFCISRAECLLGLFLHTVERPRMKEANMTAPDEGKIDFLDADRMEVLFGVGNSD